MARHSNLMRAKKNTLTYAVIQKISRRNRGRWRARLGRCGRLLVRFRRVLSHQIQVHIVDPVVECVKLVLKSFKQTDVHFETSAFHRQCFF